MKASKKLALICALALLMSGCANAAGINEETSSVTKNDSSAAESVPDTAAESSSLTDSDTSSETKEQSTLVLPETEEVAGASFILHNDAFSPKAEDIKCSLTADTAAMLYSEALTAYQNSAKAYAPSDLDFADSVCFIDSSGKRLVLGCYETGFDASFAWLSEDGAAEFFQPDKSTADDLAEDINTYAAVSVLLDTSSFEISQADTDGELLNKAVLKLSVSDVSENTEIYLSKTARSVCRTVNAISSNNGYACYIRSSDITLDGEGADKEDEVNEFLFLNEYSMTYSYEKIDGKWCSVEEISYPDNFISIMLQTAANSFDYCKGFDVSADGNKYTCEVFKDTDTGHKSYFLFDSKGEIFAEWNGTALIFCSLSAPDKETIEQIIEQAKAQAGDNNTFGDMPEQAQKYMDENDLFDISGGVEKGEKIDNAHLVSDWHDYFRSHREFSYEAFMVGEERTEHEIYTDDGKNYYIYSYLDIYSDNDPYFIEEIVVDGTAYSSWDSGESYTSYPANEYYKCTIPAPFDPNMDNLSFVDAYYATIDGVKYQCEEWTNNVHLYKVYFKDGKPIAMQTDFYSAPVVYTFKKLEKTADSSLIKAPARSQPHVPND